MILEAAALLTIAAVVYYLYRGRNVSYWYKRNVPVPPNCHWFWGHFGDTMAGKKHLGLMFADFYSMFPEAPVVGYLKTSLPGLVIRDPDVIKSVLMSDFSSFAKNEINIDKKKDILFGRSPFVSEGEEWKLSRGHATPAVTFLKLKGYLPTIAQVGDEMVRYVNMQMDENGSAEFEAKDFASIYTTDVVANAICGIESNTFKDRNSLFGTLMVELMNSFVNNRFQNVLGLAFPELKPALRFTSDHHTKLLVDLTRQMLKEKAESADARSDLFQQMLAFRKNDKDGVFTDEYIASHVYNFILDGYETSSIVISYVMYELAWNEEAQNKLREELIKLTARTKGDYTVEDIEGFKYLDMVVSETLRLNPPVLSLTKECTNDYNLINAYFKKPLKIKKGTLMTIPVYGLHMDSRYYEDPKKFDPERFTDEATAARDKFVHLPFGEGPRRCFGARFGLLQTKVAVIKIIENFRLRPNPKTSYPVIIDPQVFALNKAAGGLWITMEKLTKPT